MKLIYSKILMALCLGLFTQAASAQVFVNQAATGNNDGSSWTDAYTDIQDALDNVALDGEVWVAAGTYKPGEDAPLPTNSYTFPKNLKFYGGFAGTETMLSERDIDANLTLLSGDLAGDDTPGTFGANRTDNAMHIIFLTDTITTATVISGFTFSGGNTVDGSGSGDDRRGGAILSYGAFTLSDCIFTDNYGWFGSVYPRGSSSSGTSITDCTFENNSGGSGCGIYFATTANGVVSNCEFLGNEGGGRGGAIYLNNGSVDISDCTFNNNSASTSTGGAIHFRSGDTNVMTLTDCTFFGNSATWGGAVNTYNATSTTIIDNCAFQGNTSINRGGAIYMGFLARTEIIDSDFTLNTTEGTGGAISAQNDTTSCSIIGSDFTNNGAPDGFEISGGAVGMFGGISLDIDDCFFEGNTADFGGAVSLTEDSVDVAQFNISNSIFQVNLVTTQAAGLNIGGADGTVENCLFTNNVNTGTAGGAIAFNTGGVRPTNVKVINSTLVSNTASIGAGIASFTDEADTLTLNIDIQNVILTNDGNNYEVEAGTPTITSLGGNLSTDTSLDDIFLTNDISGMDPLFVDAVAFDYHLLEGSPCINAGVDAGAPTLDLDGNPRVGQVDIGCFENDGTSSIKVLEGVGSLSIYPNPVRSNLNFDFESELRGNMEVRITDLNGQLYHMEQLPKHDELLNRNVNVADLSTGIYFLNITVENRNISTRFIKM